MKDFRGMIDRYLLDHEQQKKYLAIVLALSMLVTFAVPLSLMQNAESTTVKPVFTTQLANAVAFTNLSGNINTTDVELLLGSDHPELQTNVQTGTIEEAINEANRKYALGIASQFCVFLKEDFTPTLADAEGRIAVGRNFYARTKLDNSVNEYEAGNGDFVARVDLDLLIKNQNYAHSIINGQTIEGLVLSSWAEYKNGPLSADKAYVDKRIWVSHPDGIIVPSNFSSYGNSEGNIRWSGNYKDYYFSGADAFNVAEQYDELIRRSERIANLSVKGVYKGIIDGAAVFDASAYGDVCDTVYFHLTEQQWEEVNDATTIKYINVPKLKEKRKVVETKGNYDASSAEYYDVEWEHANIVISVDGVGSKDDPMEISEIYSDTSTYINGISVTVGKADEDGGDAKRNNNAGVTSLLYNFHEAEWLVLGKNFQGTIFAPKARATDKSFDANGVQVNGFVDGAIKKEGRDTQSNGHLSGALIAVSYYGGTEFGYRPYAGSIDILGSTSGYPIPMSKFDEDGNGLANASFTLKKGDEIVESWTSNGGDKPQYITIPTAVDYDGGTNYNTATKDITTTYTMQEASPPEGYIGTNDQYTITVREVIDPSGLIKADETSENMIPTKVDVTITVVAPNGDKVLDTTMTVTDTYDTESNQQTRRKIAFTDGDTFILQMQNGKVSRVDWVDGEEYTEITEVMTIDTTSDTIYTVDSYWSDSKIETTRTEEVAIVVTTTATTASTEPAEPIEPAETVESAEADESETTTTSTSETTTVQTIKTIIVHKEEVGTSVLVYTTNTAYTEATTSYTVVSSFTTYDGSMVLDGNQVQTAETCTVTGIEIKTYYFDPDSMMLMPVPTAVPSFTNRYGYVFEKNDGSEPLSSADMANAVIYLEKKDGENYSQIKQITSSRITLEPDELTENTLYRFNEQTPPSGYEQADPVYIVKSGGKIYWLSSAEEPSVDTVKNSPDYFIITDDNLDNRTIEMKDQKIYGAKVKLQKTDVTGTTKLTGAYFRLLTGNTKVYPVDNWNEGFRIDEELDLFEVLKAAAPESYDENYVQDGYLKKGTYSLEEVTAPGGYQTPAKPYKFKIELDNGNYTIVPLSSDAPEYITFTASTDWGKEIWAYGSATDVTKIEVEVASPADGSTLFLYEDPVKTSLHGKYVSVVGGVATFTEVPNAIGNFKVQNQSYDTGVTVKEVRVYGTASDGGSTETEKTDFGDGITVDHTTKEITMNSTGLARVTDEMIANDDVVLQLTFNTSSDQMGWGNAKFTGNANGTEYKQTASSYLPSGCNSSEYQGNYNIGFNQTTVTVQLTVSEICKILGIEKAQFRTISSFGVSWWNSTTVSGVDFPCFETSSSDPETTPEESESTNTNSMPLTVTGNTISIPNELMGAKTDITVQKDWEKDELYSSVTRPDKITVQLYQATTQEQMTNNQGTAYGDPVEITPNMDGEWTHTWSQIPNQVTNTDGSVTTYLYYAREVSTPSGYTVLYPDDGKTIIHITNTLNTISLTAHKKWVDSKGNAITSNSIPGVTLPEISVKLQYSENGTDGWKDLPNSTQTLNASNSWTYNYKDIPSGYTYKMVERDVPDGWTVGESTTTNQNNGTVEIENKLQTGSLQVTKKWSGDESDTSTRPGSITVNVYRKEVVNSGTAGGSAEDDTTGGNTEVSEDAVVARFLYQKGNGYTDHDTYWGPPESQPSRANQMYWTTNSASDIAANYAAALAQFAVNFPGDDKSENYLNAAKALYDFSTKYNSCATEHCSGFYPSTSCTDEQAWAAAWLYLATNDATYKTACETKLSACGNPEIRGYFWDDVMLGAEAVYAAHIDDTPSWTKVTNYLNTYCTGDSFRVLNGWGSARHNALLQTLALVTDKNMQTQNYQEWCKNQMSIILGNNTFGNNGTAVNLVIGFADNAIKNPHHKAATGTILVDTVNDVQWDDIWNTWNGIFGDESHVLVGALASGPNGSTVNDNCKDHTGNEVALDYNAGLVGAAAGLYSVYGTGTLVNNGADIDSEVESKYDGFAVTRQPAYTSNITEDYSRLLQYSLYFYDANMCGDFTAENSAFSWRSACHTDDEVDGGFHDAGDHVMFGLPQGFSASTLGWVYYEFRDSFDSLGQTAHYKTIMEEFCDFFVDSIEFEEPSQQTLTLSNTQSQKASAIKGISVVGSEKVAKDSTLYTDENGDCYYKLDGMTFTESGQNTLYQYNNLNYEKINRICIDFTYNGSWGLGFKYNDSVGPDWMQTDKDPSPDWMRNIIIDNPTTITSLKFNAVQFWSGGNVVINEIRLYTEASTPVFSITAKIPDNRTEALLNDTVTLTPTNNAGNVTYTVKYADNTIETLTGNSFIPKKSGTVTITGNDGTTNAETQITVSSMTMSIPNNNTTLTVGSSATLTLANVGYDITSWTANVENVVTIQPNGSTAQITATAACADGVTITATDANGNTASIKITIPDPDVLSLSCNKQKMRVDDTANLTPSPADEVTYQLSKEGIVEINGNTVTAVGVGQVTITAKRKGYEAPVTINVVEALTITGDPTMNIDETQTLTANGAIGTITWAISGEDEGIVTLDAATGEVTAEKNGNVTIIATDSHDNAVAEFTISVELTAANANIPSGAELIGQIEVKLDTATGEWTKNEGLNGFDPENLPLCSPNGNPYKYYIEEVLTDGVVSGNSASYVPIEYLGSGVQLANGSAAAMSVENELKSSTETTGTLPSTGGGGVKIYYAAGLVMMLSGIAGYFVTKRRRNSQS